MTAASGQVHPSPLERAAWPSGLVVVDKPAGWTSHDVVAKIRRLAGTRRVGHAGTLDPMATGVLVVGVGKATRLLGYLALGDKQYRGTVRLGQTTSTDDADGTIVAERPASQVRAGTIAAAAARLTGSILQVPPGVSAIKVDGERAYRLTRRGQEPNLAARRVTVSAFEVLGIRPHGDLVDVDIAVTCSSGTYIRALARDLGAALGVGGHLTMLRRTRVGSVGVSAARTLDRLAESPEVISLEAAAAAAFPRRDLDEAEAGVVAHGGRIPAAGGPVGGPDGGLSGPGGPGGPGEPGEPVGGPTAAFAPDGSLVALLTTKDGLARPVVVFR